jgi:hypothetical protein
MFCLDKGCSITPIYRTCDNDVTTLRQNKAAIGEVAHENAQKDTDNFFFVTWL